MGRLKRPGFNSTLGSDSMLRRVAVASLVMNILIIVTGALVRLTDSGLGCPTWPQCTPGSYTPHAALGIHGVIEFSNRMITFVLTALAVLTLIVAWLNRRPDGSRPPRVRWVALGIFLGIPAQAVIGGISVLTKLNPYVVALHLVSSMVLVALAVWLVRLTWPAPPRVVGRRARVLALIAFGLTWVVVCLGTIVTGSGPHAGDAQARRTGLDPATVAHVHSTAVYLLVAATIGCLLMFRNRAVVLLLLAEVAQAIIGFVQYYTGLPVALVAIHLLGAASTMALAANLAYSVRVARQPESGATGLRADSEPASDHRASAGLPTPSQPVPAASRPTPHSGPAAAAPPAPDRA